MAVKDTNAYGGTSISLRVEFSGGLELLFSNQRSHRLNIPSLVPSNNETRPSDRSAGGPVGEKPTDVDYLIHHLRDHLLQERAELFMENDTVQVYCHVFSIGDDSLL